MEQIVKVKVMYLDNLLKQLINYKKFKDSVFRDDVPAITKKLLADLKTIYCEITREITTTPSQEIGEVYFNNRALSFRYSGDWRLIRQLDRLNLVKEKILEE